VTGDGGIKRRTSNIERPTSNVELEKLKKQRKGEWGKGLKAESRGQSIEGRGQNSEFGIGNIKRMVESLTTITF